MFMCILHPLSSHIAYMYKHVYVVISSAHTHMYEFFENFSKILHILYARESVIILFRVYT